MKIVEIRDGHVHHIYDEYKTLAEARSRYANNIQLEEAPDSVFEGWGFNPHVSGDARYITPELSPGFLHDGHGGIWNPEEMRSGERMNLHARTTNDTMQALRKIREGDTSIDWSAWLDALDAYNVAIEETKNQPGYPLKVEYPEYPKKPTA